MSFIIFDNEDIGSSIKNQITYTCECEEKNSFTDLDKNNWKCKRCQKSLDKENRDENTMGCN